MSETLRRRLALALIVLISMLTAVLGVSGPALGATPTPTPTPVPTTSSTTVISAGATCQPSATAGCVSGTLRDVNGNGVKGVRMRLDGASGATAAATSNADGHFTFTVAKSGSYALTLVTTSLPKGITAPLPKRTITVALNALEPAFFNLKGTFKGSKASADAASTSPLLQIWDQITSGLLLGLLLALASIGLSLIYGTTGLSNFAHAEQITLGGLLAYLFAVQLHLPLVVAAVITIVLCAASGFAQDRLIWGPLRRRGLGLVPLTVVTIGLSLALEYIYQYSFGGTVLSVSSAVQVQTGPLDLTPIAYLSMGISVVVLVLIGLILQRTRIGRATRAVSDNRALSAASGIDVDRIIRLVWTVSMGLAGLAGILYALVYGGIAWNTGQALLLLIFAAVTLGGLGTAFGALVGSLVIGLVVQLSALFLAGDAKFATALVILILVLLLRPQGILGRSERVG